MALLLTLFAVLIGVALSASFLGAQSTTLGISRNARNHAQARYVAESGMEIAITYARSNSNWRTAQPHGTWVADQPFAAGTFTIVGEDGEDTDADGIVEGDGSLSDDGGDLVTLTVTGRVGGASHVIRSILTPEESSGALLAYGEVSQGQPRVRAWESSAWAGEQSASSVGAEPQWIVLRHSPTADECALAVLDFNKSLKVQMQSSTSWGTPTQCTADAGLKSSRVFDVAYEQLSGQALIAYRSGIAAGIRYRTYDGTAWSAESSHALMSASPTWVKLVPKPGSDEILILAAASGDAAAAVWNGTAFANAQSLSVSGLTYLEEWVDAAYESVSGQALIVHSVGGASAPSYRTWNGSSWSASGNAPSVGSTPHWIALAADPASDEIIMAALGDDERLDANVWTGSAWGSNQELETNVESSDRRMFDVAYEGGGNEALILYQRNNPTVRYRTWNGSAWSNESAFGVGGGNKPQVIQAVTGCSMGQVFVVFLEGAMQLKALTWDGTAFSVLTTLESSAGADARYESFMIATFSSGAGGGSATQFGVGWQEAP